MRVFTNATILCGEDFEVLKNGYVAVKDGTIKEIGEGMSPYKNAIDCKRGIISPAFTNAHVHLGDSIAQDIGAYEPIKRRVGKDGIKFKVLESDSKKIRMGVSHSLNEMQNYGTTAFCDFREGGIKGIEQIKKSMVDTSNAVVLGRPDGDDIDLILERCDGIGVSSVDSYTPEELRRMSKACKKNKKYFAFHSCEVKDDFDRVMKYGPDFLVHMTNATDESIEKVFKDRIPIVLCPRANAMLGTGIPDIRIFGDTLVALGTDNVMVNSLNMLREMEFAFKALRGIGKDYRFDGRKILQAATINGRKMLGLLDNAVEDGNIADFIIFKRREHLYNPILAIIHRYEIGDIRGMVNVQEYIGTH